MESPPSQPQRTRQRNRTLALLTIGVGLILVAAVGFAAWPRQIVAETSAGATTRSVVPQAVSFPAPTLALADLEGRPVSLESLRGAVVLLNNWATWCPPCREEMPALMAYHQQHQSQGFTVIAVDAEEDAATVRDYIQETALELPIWLDPKGEMFEVFHHNSLPSSFVIDRQGTVRLVWFGAISYDMLEEHVTPLLGKE